MKLINLNDYCKMVFAPGSAPHAATLRRQIADHKVPGGVKRGGRYYVDLDMHDGACQLSKSANAKLDEMRQSPLLNGLI
jgi:hypothetical protein